MEINDIGCALDVLIDFENAPSVSGEDEFMYTEALKLLIDKLGDPEYIFALGGFYYEKQKFDLALKYYEAAAEKGYARALEGLGYIWYYGRTGVVDYEKAYDYFSRAAKKGRLNSEVKLADMYLNGYHVQQDYYRYKTMIKDIHRRLGKTALLDDPLPEVDMRYAEIQLRDNKFSAAESSFRSARHILEMRLVKNPFFGTLEQLKRVIEGLYKCSAFDYENITLYDLFRLLKEPVKLRFCCGDEIFYVESVSGDGGMEVFFDGKWYRGCEDLFMRAELDGVRITALYDKLHGFEVI